MPFRPWRIDNSRIPGARMPWRASVSRRRCTKKRRHPGEAPGCRGSSATVKEAALQAAKRELQNNLFRFAEVRLGDKKSVASQVGPLAQEV
jgi:hypothetical protein